MNWKKILQELCASGMTQAEISSEVGLAQASISDIVRGRTKAPSWDPGQKIIALHDHVCKKVRGTRDRRDRRKRVCEPLISPKETA